MLKNKTESSLHRSLKFQYSAAGTTETQIGDYVCDGLSDRGEIIEVQLGNFSPLREKVKSLLKKNKVRIIYPVIIQKQIELYDTNGKLISKRKSPRKGTIWDVFKALVFAPEFPLLKKLTIELALVDVLERRVNDGKGSWRRKGVSVQDRFLERRRESIVLKSLKDYNQFLPFTKKECFTIKDLAKKASIKPDIARKAVSVLCKIGLVEQAGKQGRAYVYRRH